MATATTTPEFFTNVISTFVTESDIGLGTIIGSLMFNTLGVAAVASFAATKPVQLDWWPFTRDISIYAINIFLLVIFVYDGQISLDETIYMVTWFFIYFIILYQNKRIMPAVKWFWEEYLNCCKVSSYGTYHVTCKLRIDKNIQTLTTLSSFSDLPTSFIEKNLANTVITLKPNDLKQPDPLKRSSQSSISRSSINNDPIFMIYSKDTNSIVKKELRKSLWRLPVSDRLKTAWWAYTWPIKFILTLTIPNPKTYRRLYPLTFFMCVLWIGVNTYMIVWMITMIGKLNVLLIEL